MSDTTYPSFTKTYHHDVYPAIDPTQSHLSCRGLTIVITGAGTGIGQAIAIAFAQARARGIVLIGRTESTLQDTASKIHSESEGKTEALILQADVTNASEIQSAFSRIDQHFGEAPHVLINNAGGVFAAGTIANIDLDGFNKTFVLNVMGPLTVTQAFIRAAEVSDVEKAKQRTIINIPSGAAHVVAPGSLAYGTSKMACSRITEYAHYEHPTWRVFNMQPGVVATELARKAGRKAEDTPQLPGSMAVWLTRDPRAVDLNGRFLWANWDVEELLAMKDEIKREDKLVLGLKGWAEGYTNEDLIERAKRVAGNLRRTD